MFSSICYSRAVNTSRNSSTPPVYFAHLSSGVQLLWVAQEHRQVMVALLPLFLHGSIWRYSAKGGCTWNLETTEKRNFLGKICGFSICLYYNDFWSWVFAHDFSSLLTLQFPSATVRSLCQCHLAGLALGGNCSFSWWQLLCPFRCQGFSRCKDKETGSSVEQDLFSSSLSQIHRGPKGPPEDSCCDPCVKVDWWEQVAQQSFKNWIWRFNSISQLLQVYFSVWSVSQWIFSPCI